MFLASIMPLDALHVEEVCEDIRRQYEAGSFTCALFCMTLTPEGDPPIDKAKMLCETFALYRERLSDCGIQVGALVQATIGHGYQLNVPFGFMPYHKLINNDSSGFTCCPADEGFRDYIFHAMQTIATYKPDVIMVDDDFRLLARPGRGCACPLHLAMMEKKLGRPITREEILEHAQGTSEEDIRIRDLFFETQGESLIGAAKAMRDGIDSVDPSIPGMFCCCGKGAEYAGEIAQILAGKGNPVVVRVNNGNYTAAGARNLTNSMLRAAVQIAVMRDKVDMFLAETDTCPQNRYSTSASGVHAHLTGSILEGVSGAKHWITRLHAYEPASGLAYRKKLAQFRGYYEELSRIVPTLKWIGCRIPVSSKPIYAGFAGMEGTSDGWSSCVLERLGLPMFFSDKPEGTTFLCEADDMQFSDAEILELFRHPLVLAGMTAKRLIERGFGRYIGVDVREYHGKHISGETAHINGNKMNVQQGAFELVPLSDAVQSHSDAFHVPDGHTHEYLFPAVTSFVNELGGRTIVFCGTPKTNFTYLEAFSFLCESRKLQLIDLLDFPIYYPEDAEIYFRAAETPDGELFAGVFNIGMDVLDEIPLIVHRPVREVCALTPDGKWETVSFTAGSDDRITVHVPAYTLNPVILLLR